MSRQALPGTVVVEDTPVSVAARAAAWVAETSARLPSFAIALSGGGTPRLLYAALAEPPHRDGVDWSRWHVYFGDERAVPPTDERSNYRLAHDSLLSRVPIPPTQVHRIEAEGGDVDGAARAYAQVLARAAGEPPRLDVVLLGIGEDGHTASLFPGTLALGVVDAWATRGVAPTAPTERVSLTFPAVNAAANVAFLVNGASKGDALRGVCEGSVPAARVRPQRGTLTWFLDAAAAASLE